MVGPTSPRAAQGSGAVRYCATFGTKRPRVQISAPRPDNDEAQANRLASIHAIGTCRRGKGASLWLDSTHHPRGSPHVTPRLATRTLSLDMMASS